MMPDQVNPASFRDPSGFVFTRDGRIYRQVNKVYKDDYDHLMESGLYDSLVAANLVVPHKEVGLENAVTPDAYQVLEAEIVPFISYPYEWCFSQLKDAALATLRVQKLAFKYGMTLKDCSAYNIQYLHGKPIFIDLLSFEKYEDGQPWIPYRQYCQHFLAPLSLMAYSDIRLNQLFRIHIDGVPLDLASLLLPRRTWLRFSLLTHIHLHAKSQKFFGDKGSKKRKARISRLSFEALVDGLDTATRKLCWRPAGSEWGDYYDDTNYSSFAMEHKKKLVGAFLEKIEPVPTCVWDLGANTGMFSEIASGKGIRTVAFDVDFAAVEKNYVRRKDGTNILPLVLDLTNPSPGIGWANKERMKLIDRGPAGAILALALVHHLAISNNVPLSRIAAYFGQLCNWLIIEFVPKNDSQVQRLLASREDIFDEYTEEVFTNTFSKTFEIIDSVKIEESLRTMYLMKKKDTGITA